MPDITINELHAKSASNDLAPAPDPESGSALDALAEEVGAKPKSEVAPAAAVASGDDAPPRAELPSLDPDKEATDKKAADEKAAADKVAADAAKAEADKKAAEGAVAKDPLDEVPFPPHTSVKAAESFMKLKAVAKERYTALEKQFAETQTNIAKLQEELNSAKANVGKVPETVDKELKDLRQFKVAHDVESDPAFKQFDSDVKANEESVYKKLEAHGFTKEHLGKIRELGGPEKVDWESIADKLPSHIYRFIESKLVENEGLRDKRENALRDAKVNADGFLKQRAERDMAELTETANGFLKNLPWTAPKPIPANAKPEEKAAIESANKFAAESMARLNQYFSDRSPGRFAELAVGTLIAHKNQAELEQLNAKLTKMEADNKVALESVTKERDAAKTELDKIKRAEVPRNRLDGLAPKPGPRPGEVILTDGSSALDAHYAELSRRE